MLDPDVSKLVLRPCVVDGDRAVLDQLLDDQMSQRDVLCPKRVGEISANIKRRCIFDGEEHCRIHS